MLNGKIIDKTDKGLMGIYKVVNLINNKLYVGSSIDLYRRMKEHIGSLKNNKHFNYHLQNSWNKHGQEFFVFKIIEYINDKKLLTKREQHWMEIYNVCNQDYGYNINPKADNCAGRPMQEKTKIKISNTLKGRKLEHTTGENNHLSVLTEEQVKDIKLRLYNGDYIYKIHKNYTNICLDTLYDIKNNETWKHILPELDLKNCKRKNNSKLNDQEVIEIIKSDLTIKELVNLYKVSKVVIGNIKRGVTHKDIIVDETLIKYTKLREGKIKLNKEKVLEIRMKISQGYDLILLTEEYSVSISTIRAIKNYKIWKDVLITTM